MYVLLVFFCFIAGVLPLLLACLLSSFPAHKLACVLLASFRVWRIGGSARVLLHLEGLVFLCFIAGVLPLLLACLLSSFPAHKLACVLLASFWVWRIGGSVRVLKHPYGKVA